MEAFFLILFCPVFSSPSLFCEAQMFFTGQAVTHTPKVCKERTEDGLKVGTLGCSIDLYGLGDERGCRQTQRVSTPKRLILFGVTDAP